MSTNQLNNNKKQNEFILRERTHNTLSTAFFFLLSLIYIFIIVASSILNSIYVIIPASIILIFSIIKIIYQFKSIISFSKLTKTIDDTQISFYITKNWNRKREATICFAIIAEVIIAIPIILVLVLFPTDLLFPLLTLFASMLFILISAYINLQTIEGYMKISERKMNLHSVEWMQIKKDQKIFYRLIIIYFFSALLIIPLFLLIIPSYRKTIYNLVKK